ncbi:MAG: hypothetical protein WC391_06095 [Methanoregula sp.]
MQKAPTFAPMSMTRSSGRISSNRYSGISVIWRNDDGASRNCIPSVDVLIDQPGPLCVPVGIPFPAR